jgi:hypothetical protein
MRIFKVVVGWLRSSTPARSFGRSDVVRTVATSGLSLAALLAAVAFYPGAEAYVRDFLVGLFPGFAEPIGAAVVLAFWGLRFYFSGRPPAVPVPDLVGDGEKSAS